MTSGPEHRRETVAIAAGRPERVPGAPFNEPITLASALHADGPTGYARDGMRSWMALEAAVGALDGGHAIAFSSGIAACAAVLDQVRIGGTVIAARTMYMGVRQLLEEAESSGRMVIRWVDLTDTAAVADAIPGADLLWIEAPQNPLMTLADVPELAAHANAAGVPVAVDATVASPMLLRPLEHGATWTVHSATKYLGGHADLLLGVAVAADPAAAERLDHHRHLHGATPGALETYLALRGIRTLPLRIQRAQENAIELATRLAAHPEIERVRYCGLPDDPGHRRMRAFMDGPGAVLAIEPTGGPERAEALCQATELFTHATSFGGIESTLERRRRWSAEGDDVPPALVRVSVGCEHVEDLWDDLARALERSSTRTSRSYVTSARSGRRGSR
jgi:cystathionine gamma-synthase